MPSSKFKRSCACCAACLACPHDIPLQQEGYELLETHDGQGALVIVDYLVKTPLGNLQVGLGLRRDRLASVLYRLRCEASHGWGAGTQVVLPIMHYLLS